jgi:hypothetical protein
MLRITQGFLAMKTLLICLVGLFVNFAGNAAAQDSHISSKYNQDSKETVVSTDPMFLLYALDSRMAVEFSFSYPKQKLVKSPKIVYLSLKSLTQGVVKYPKTTDQKVYLLADGDEIPLDDLVYLATIWIIQKDQLVGVNLKNFQVKNDEVLDENGKPIHKPVQEEFTVRIKQENFVKLSKAQAISVRVNGSAYDLTPNQANTVRTFAQRTIPE